MRRAALSAATLVVGLAACNYNKEYNEQNAAYGNEAYSNATGYAEGTGGNYSGAQTATATWPPGSRIVVEKGVTYRIEPGGVRVALGPNESRILVENGVRYRVDPSGTRVRIDESGAEITVNPPGTTTVVNATTNSP